MDKRINDLKIDFTKVVDLKNENIKMFDTLDLKIKNLKSIYSEFIKNNKQHLFIFGLDSFHFQGKLIDIEYDDMKRLYYAITNRIYCEYFKLYKIVVDYITDAIYDDKKILDLVKLNNSYPVYKDLEPFKHYDFEVIQSVHETIIGLLLAMYNYLSHKEHDLKLHQEKNATGLNIDNFIQTFNFNNLVLREKLTLFITYIEFFHKLHTKYFKRFTTKMQLFISQINHDIKFEDSVELNKTKRKSMLDTFANDNLDKNILKDLQNSIVEENALSKPSTPISTHFLEPFKSIESSDNQSSLPESSIDVPTLKGVFLQIDDSISSEVNQNSVEEKQDSDEVSLLTTESETKQEEHPVFTEVDAPKPKRKYKPRKKKDDPSV
ncbi:MAG: hypothetical protein EBY20_00130 [Alphaproteobacteria bacterium]|uniref:Uncharacterized protein n=1 Tax=viral metagenome TaxID=1070528 RepID=A0A6C0HPN8_9ZZZZ|nr:hypothetical protein [Alphaproteobacteria bacterium]